MYTCKSPIICDIDYAKKFGITHTQHKLKEIMNEIDSFCRENDINYTIAYGTQIGAIRHGGFIPWDDDMDIIMLRNDFNKFKEALSSSPDCNLTLIYDLWIERVVLDDKNIFVDIMILDNVPSLSLFASIKSILCRALQGTLKEKLVWKRYSLFNRALLMLTGLIGKILGKQFCLSFYQKIQQLGNSKKTKYVASYNSGYRDTKEYFITEWFDNYMDIKFDDLILKTNTAYHALLTSYYGDYMALPPEENRIPEHGRIL